MISEIEIENFKSIAKLSFQPGTVTVLIGENGSGKSNILEAIGFGAAASISKLDDEFLHTRGIRVTDKDLMKCAFSPDKTLDKSTKNKIEITISYRRNDAKIDPDPILIRFLDHSKTVELIYKLSSAKNRESLTHNEWFLSATTPLGLALTNEESELLVKEMPKLSELIKSKQKYDTGDEVSNQKMANILRKIASSYPLSKDNNSELIRLTISNFLIYAPENSALRNFQTEGAIKPLGVKGEGLLKHLFDLSLNDNGDFANELKSHLALLGWFGDLHLPTQVDEIRGSLRIQDRWLTQDGRIFDQRSANEGFLYLLFYFTLFLSKQTPKFFAIDNLDNALNPKLCAELMRQLAVLAEKNGKQVIVTTHNPAILDGLNLHDDKQRLFVVRRNSEGHTIVDRVKAPRPRPDGQSVRLSQAFMSGMLGGLPEHF